MQSYKHEDIAAASVMLILFNIATLALVGVFLFKERLSFWEIIGLILGVFAIVFLELANIIESAEK